LESIGFRKEAEGYEDLAVDVAETLQINRILSDKLQKINDTIFDAPILLPEFQKEKKRGTNESKNEICKEHEKPIPSK